MRYNYTSSLAPYRRHPLTRAAPRTADAQAEIRAAECAASVIATLRSVRRLAKTEPPEAFCRTVQLAVNEVQTLASQFRSAAVEEWKRGVLGELIALLFEHVPGAEVELVIRRDLRLAQRNGDA